MQNDSIVVIRRRARRGVGQRRSEKDEGLLHVLHGSVEHPGNASGETSLRAREGRRRLVDLRSRRSLVERGELATSGRRAEDAQARVQRALHVRSLRRRERTTEERPQGLVASTEIKF